MRTASRKPELKGRDLGAFCPKCDGWFMIMSLEFADKSDVQDLYRAAQKRLATVREFDIEKLRDGSLAMCECNKKTQESLL